MTDLVAIAEACARGERSAWSYAPLRRAGVIAAFLIEPTLRRVAPLRRGATLLANEDRLRAHAFPSRWFEAAWLVIEIDERGARVADARSTNGAELNGVALPTSPWRAIDPAALMAGDDRDRVDALDPAWQPLRDGDVLRARFPAGAWTFVSRRLVG